MKLVFAFFYDTLVKLICKNDSILGFLYFKIKSKKTNKFITIK